MSGLTFHRGAPYGGQPAVRHGALRMAGLDFEPVVHVS
jgi:hypothetical protein